MEGVRIISVRKTGVTGEIRTKKFLDTDLEHYLCQTAAL
jgi:hypothetical protein